jgi:Xaa-Pro aminopeptidase
VITIEPGWYDKKEGYGIRIEDTYVITKDGFERLSAAAPREIEEIEAAMKGKKEY